MSISPFKLGMSKPRSPAQKGEALTLSEALLITAGLAGLIGLGGGTIVRFSLAHSPNARFLSPSQTFPALSNWATERPQGTVDTILPGTADGSPATIQIPTFEPPKLLEEADDAQPGSTLSTGTKSFDAGTFDTFADREDGDRQTVDPWETLKQGPSLGIVESAEEGAAETDTAKNDADSSTADADAYYGEENYQQDYSPVEEPGAGDRPYYGDGQY